MFVHPVEFRGDDRPAQDDAPRTVIDRSAEAMQRLRNPFDLQTGAHPSAAPV
ncbi:hypothetical protein Aph02nite_90480 [Actinoplanes philippinensis]|uniref:Uncharacterized protein n=1 Tax=Actinoplanes philippinensis TaxID=35752 RepID=A0A1I2M7J9_9ACTN|nr:hypothetical protein [Actinoplanes philippinensis]GIE83098.1 hypothetical protein Aph02nite_90480 [Actinoplanes philippinensis]SFF87483.1 hypothetical protein SAMN05421541_12738 [Actinoplanes philippinensis]